MDDIALLKQRLRAMEEEYKMAKAIKDLKPRRYAEQATALEKAG